MPDRQTLPTGERLYALEVESGRDREDFRRLEVKVDGVAETLKNVEKTLAERKGADRLSAFLYDIGKVVAGASAALVAQHVFGIH